VFGQNIFLITPISNTFNLCSSVNLEGYVSHPYAISGLIIVLSSKGHPKKSFKTVICRQKLVYNNQGVKIVIQLSDRFLYLIHKRFDSFLRPSQFFCTSMTAALLFSRKNYKCHPTALYINHLPTLFTYC